MRDDYSLVRGGHESQRLDKQVLLYGRALAYQLAPRIKTETISAARIADVGTGTAAWIREVAKEVPPSSEFHGFDISDAQYPSTDSLPPNIRLHLHDAKSVFPAEFLGSFDVVHLRLLSCAMEPDEWKVVAHHCFQLLKPGGYIQWDEIDLSPMTTMLRDSPGATRKSLEALTQKTLKLQGRRLLGSMGLVNVLPRVGFSEVDVDQVCNDRVHKDRICFMDGMMTFMEGILTKCREIFMPGAPSEAELDAMLKGAREDLVSSTYFHFYIRVLTGRKPVE